MGEERREREIDEDPDLVAGLCGENRNFIAVQLGGQTYKALFDPGAMLSLVALPPCGTPRGESRE